MVKLEREIRNLRVFEKVNVEYLIVISNVSTKDYVSRYDRTLNFKERSDLCAIGYGRVQARFGYVVYAKKSLFIFREDKVLQKRRG